MATLSAVGNCDVVQHIVSLGMPIDNSSRGGSCRAVAPNGSCGAAISEVGLACSSQYWCRRPRVRCCAPRLGARSAGSRDGSRRLSTNPNMRTTSGSSRHWARWPLSWPERAASLRKFGRLRFVPGLGCDGGGSVQRPRERVQWWPLGMKLDVSLHGAGQRRQQTCRLVCTRAGPGRIQAWCSTN